MSNENNNIQTVEVVNKEKFWETKCFRKFVTVALGSFVGVFCALSLFAALHKPPMPPCPMVPYHYGRPPMHHQIDRFDRFDRGPRGDYRKMDRREIRKFQKRDFERQIPVRVNVETEK